jgi:CBS domain-containing protein
MRAADVMTTEVVSVTPETSILSAAQLMLEHHVSGLPVLDAKGMLVGMISEGDLMHRREIGTDNPHKSWWLALVSGTSDAQQYVKAHARSVADVMSPDVISVEEHMPLRDIANVLETFHIKRVPVVREGVVVGVVSRANLVQALASQYEPVPAQPDNSDSEIRRQLLEEMKGHAWAFLERNIVVTDGVVHLWGYRPPEQVRAMRVAAEGISGVKGVEDHTETFQILPVGL